MNRALARGSSLVLLVMAGATAANAGDTPASTVTPSPPHFSSVFPNPTGQNGFEQIVAAADLVRDSAALDTATSEGSTLSQKRAALADPVCRQALGLARAGLAMPNLLSPAVSGENGDLPLWRDMPRLRRLGSLFAVEQYVLLADGRTGAAIGSLEDAFRLTDAVRVDSVSGFLYAQIIDRQCMNQLVMHSGQWSLADCDRILGLVQQRIALQPDPGKILLEAWHRSCLKNLAAGEAMKIDPANPASVADLNPNNEASLVPFADATVAISADPVLRHQAYAAVRGYIDALFARAEAEDPYSPMENAVSPGDVVPAGADPRIRTFVREYAHVALSNPVRARRKLAIPIVQLRLLGAHAAIRRYRWQYGRLPAQLTAVDAADLTTDPYTHAPFRYTLSPDGNGYSLISAGPPGGETGTGPETSLGLPTTGTVWR